MANVPAVRVRHLSVTIAGQPILRNLSFSVAAGSIVGLLGPSGSGKTTLIRSLLGLQKPSVGELAILGDKPGSTANRSRVGYVSQSPSVYPDLTIQENVYYFAALVGVSKQQADLAIQQVDLARHNRQTVSDLSGGQRSRVSLAVALLGSPELLLLDEPTVGLDPVLRQKLWAMFSELSHRGITLIISSHVMDEASHCDELLFLRDGQLLADGTPETIRQQTKTKDMEAAFIKLAEATPDSEPTE